MWSCIGLLSHLAKYCQYWLATSLQGFKWFSTHLPPALPADGRGRRWDQCSLQGSVSQRVLPGDWRWHFWFLFYPRAWKANAALPDPEGIASLFVPNVFYLLPQMKKVDARLNGHNFSPFFLSRKKVATLRTNVHLPQGGSSFPDPASGIMLASQPWQFSAG